LHFSKAGDPLFFNATLQTAFYCVDFNKQLCPVLPIAVINKELLLLKANLLNTTVEGLVSRNLEKIELNVFCQTFYCARIDPSSVPGFTFIHNIFLSKHSHCRDVLSQSWCKLETIDCPCSRFCSKWSSVH